MMHDTDEYDDDDKNDNRYDNNDDSYDDDDNDDRDDDDRNDDDDSNDADDSDGDDDYGNNDDDDIEVPGAWVGEPEGTSVVARFSFTQCNMNKITIIKNMIGDIFRNKDDQRKVVEN